MKYLVNIHGHDVTVDIDGERVTVDGQEMTARIDRSVASPEFRLIVDGAARRMALDGDRSGVWRLVHHGTVHEVLVEDERTRHIRLLAGSSRPAESGASLKAPMPGLVIRVMVKVGDLVQPGTPLVALEAMKMENELKAATGGVVQAVIVTPGQAVEKGQVLLELAPATG